MLRGVTGKDDVVPKHLGEMCSSSYLCIVYVDAGQGRHFLIGSRRITLRQENNCSFALCRKVDVQ
jgi:hypothetical protein